MNPICPVCQKEMKHLGGKSVYVPKWECDDDNHNSFVFSDGFWALNNAIVQSYYDVEFNRTFVKYNGMEIEFDFKVEFKDSFTFVRKLLNLKAFL
jgi:hypothetical protein